MKNCTQCKQLLELSSFYKNGNRYRSECKECSKRTMIPRHRRHYLANKDKVKQKNIRSKVVISEFLRSCKDRPCADCGQSYPYWVMDFDHLHSKNFNLGSAPTRRLGMDRIKKEVEKCEVVCSNCHRTRSYNRRMVRLAGIEPASD